VVGHQHVGVNRASETPGELFESVQVKAVVLLRVETHRAVVAALNDVPGNARNTQPCTARHGDANEDVMHFMLPENRGLSPIYSVWDMFHTCSQRVGSANRNRAGIDFPRNGQQSRESWPIGYAAVGTTWVGSKPRGLNMREWLQPEINP
jgi:hypothetical protein